MQKVLVFNKFVEKNSKDRYLNFGLNCFIYLYENGDIQLQYQEIEEDGGVRYYNTSLFEKKGLNQMLQENRVYLTEEEMAYVTEQFNTPFEKLPKLEDWK